MGIPVGHGREGYSRKVLLKLLSLQRGDFWAASPQFNTRRWRDGV